MDLVSDLISAAKAELILDDATLIVRRERLDTLRRADALLARARRVAARLVRDALQQADDIAAQARDEAREAGRAAGQAEALARHCALLDDCLSAVFEQRNLIAQVIGDALDGLMGALDATAFDRFVGQGLARLSLTEGVVDLYVHPCRQVTTARWIADWQVAHPHLRIVVQTDATLGMGGYRAEGGSSSGGWQLSDDFPRALTALKRAMESSCVR
ncbi:MAG: HrpE/YscL family type III secretion apparatus protein [Janthinobacterium lividum]